MFRPTASDPTPNRWAAGLTALLAVPVLWWYRDLAPVEASLQLLLPWLWLVVFTLACWGVGAPFSRRVWTGDTGLAEPPAPLVLLLGAALLSLTSTAMAALGVLDIPLLNALLGGATAAGAWQLVRRRSGEAAMPALDPLIPTVFLLLAGALVMLPMVAPPVMYDALNYHLAAPQRWLCTGSFSPLPEHYFHAYPAAMGALYAFALAAVGPWGAAVLHAWMGGLAAWCAGWLAARLGPPTAGRWAACLFALTPAVLEIGGYPIADLAVAAWAGGALLAILAPGPLTTGRAAAAGVLLGSALAAKYLALATVLPAMVVAGLVAHGTGRRQLARLALLLGVAVLVLSPWLVRNLATFGNPLYPYVESLRGRSAPTGIAAEMSQNETTAMAPLERVSFVLTALVRRTFQPLQVGGVLGPLWLVLLPPALMLRGVGRRWALWGAVGVGLVAWGSLVQFGRFLLPVLVPAAVLVGSLTATLTTATPRLISATFKVLIGLVLLWSLTGLASGPWLERVRLVVGDLTTDEYMRGWVSYWDMRPELDRLVRPGEGILLVGEARIAYLPCGAVAEDPYRPPLLIRLAEQEEGPEMMARELLRRGLPWILVNEHEAARLAAMVGRRAWLEAPTPKGQRAVAEFLDERVEPVARAGPVVLLRVVP